MVSDEEIVSNYLQHIAEFIDTFCYGDLNQDKNLSGPSIDLVSRKILMEMCSFNTIIKPLPKSLTLDTSQEPSASPYGPNSKASKFVCVVRTRTDALRYLFYSLAPIALDIGARIVSLVKSSVDSTDKFSSEITSSAFVLFSLWLPHAPQLSPLVTDLFQDDRFVSPFECLVSLRTAAIAKEWILLSEAAHSICKFYYERGVCKYLLSWWDWSILFTLLPASESQLSISTSPSITNMDTEDPQVSRWHGVRALAYLFNLRSSARLEFFKYLEVDEDKVPWTPHPWVLVDEEIRIQEERIGGIGSIIKDNVIQRFNVPTLDQIRTIIPLHRALAHIGHGLLMHLEGSDENDLNTRNTPSGDVLSRLIMTPTTARNLAMLGTALLCADPYPTPIMVCGPRGAGKSAIIRELARCRSKSLSTDNLLELHVDEEIDSKTLLGLFTISDIPGEFAWRPGPLTVAARTGKWVLIEDVDLCPLEIQAALVQLLESRILPLGSGKNEKCHENFRILGTCTTRTYADTTNRGRKVLHPDLWTHIQVVPLPYNELGDIGKELFPALPSAVINTIMNIFRMIDAEGRADALVIPSSRDDRPSSYSKSGRGLTSVRDLVKILRRISTNVKIEPGISFITETQRILCFVETFDILTAAHDNLQQRLNFVANIAAPAWELSVDFACNYITSRSPVLKVTSNYLEIGRCTLPCKTRSEFMDDRQKNGLHFARTAHVLQLMETIGVCIQQNEPILLVGETGCGKTSVAQTLAKLAGFELIVQNLSLQTDSNDLLGGYRPVEINSAARQVYLAFVDLFTSTFSRTQNSDFLTFIATAYEQRRWKVLSQGFRKASKMGQEKIKGRKTKEHSSIDSSWSLAAWVEFSAMAERFERQRNLSEAGLAFAFVEGVLVEAIKGGQWVLLDEINLASGETLQRLCSLLDDSGGSLTVTERGDSDPIRRHPDFRLIAAMNPATDHGKKDIPESIRSRFTEIYVDELVDKTQLNAVAAGYLNGVICANEVEQSETVISSVDLYLRCRKLSEETLVDSAGQRPRYSMRTFCRALSAAFNLTSQQHIPLNRAILEGFQLTFEGSLDGSSKLALKRLLNDVIGNKLDSKTIDIPGRRPGGKNGIDEYVLMKPFWLKTGPLRRHDWSIEDGVTGKCHFVLTATARDNLRRLSRAIAAGPWPVLLEGPTSTGKTTLVEYIAAFCGHRCIRINNHEHTDIQEYTGTYATNSEGRLSFQDGLLVQALRNGYWVILDELNLAPSQVLEALNRLLDDNRELYIPEINELIKPHENFRLFATQNPTGVYGGRKVLSKAFRNRFTELYVDEMPEAELVTILDKRCGCPPSHGKLLVEVMISLRKKRSKSGVFSGKDGLITPRVLIRWAERRSSSKADLAMEGYMILAERLRDDDEKMTVQKVIERVMKVQLNMDEVYWGPQSDARRLLEVIHSHGDSDSIKDVHPLSIAPTKSFLRLITLVNRCVHHREPVLLVGETGSGKTTVIQLFQILLRRRLQIVNCHANTDTSDLLGGLRPLRGRNLILSHIIEHARLLETAASNMVKEELYAFQGQLEVVPDSRLDQEKIIQKIMDYAKIVESNLGSIYELDQMQVSERCGDKRRRIEFISVNLEIIKELIGTIQRLYRRYFSLFEWVDGPLVLAMKEGSLFLLDEMSLAEDAVLERLNSVLEPSRTLTLAEKGTESASSIDPGDLAVVAHEDFRIFATMNPGGDYGKRELSPALRNRFTEIWVPPIVDRCDIDLVLARTLAFSFDRYLSNDEGLLRTCMLDYLGWFNQYLYSTFSCPKSELVLSLRDVITWAEFITRRRQDSNDIDIFESYMHGVSLMHLDGLGLGTGLSREEANTIKQSSVQYLTNQMSSIGKIVDAELVTAHANVFHINQDKCGIHPFFITAGTYPAPSSLTFNVDAPTTRVNMLRIFRAMQLSKPILLEGSPGTGKTSLVVALAHATRHKVVRINLSEQTDWSDLMGSDLPITDDCESNAGSSFKWCDGILLAAIKSGDWVILDELNLATQSVLEGLNSCLDHRASVYIPELGMTYSCARSFRIFAAQNPLCQGGGRKGLPKSFLNRFTKVYVESMTKEDYLSIMSVKFPRFPATWVDQMIEFNSQLENDIVKCNLFGQVGSPWEFNLRDLFRWGNLVMSLEDQFGKIPHPLNFIDTIYIRRLRTEKDRAMVIQRIHEIFEVVLQEENPSFHLNDKSLICGSAILSRSKRHFLDPSSRHYIQDGQPSFLRSLLRPMEAAAHCIRMNWHCLFVGSGGCGKSSVIKTLSELCNSHLVELCLTTSTDVGELVGNFEQIDKVAASVQFLEDLRDHVVSLSLFSSKLVEHNESIVDINQRVTSMFNRYGLDSSHSVAKTGWLSENSVARSEMDGIFHVLTRIHHHQLKHEKLSAMFATLCNDYQKLIQLDASIVRFKWVDGILVQALENGFWLHLENVNLCSSSVLDRLNPLLEEFGELVLTECSVSREGINEHRVIKAHPNFRLFLSMDPTHGDISRAMRNRCTEIFLTALDDSAGIMKDVLQDSPSPSISSVDSLESLWDSGIRSPALARSIVRSHMSRDTPCYEKNFGSLRFLKRWSGTISASLVRGITLRAIYDVSYRVTYNPNQLGETFVENDDDAINHKYALFEGGTLWQLQRASSRSRTWLDSRLLRIMMSYPGHLLPYGLNFSGSFISNGTYSFHDNVIFPITFCEKIKNEITLSQLIVNFVLTMLPNDADTRSTLFDGYKPYLSRRIQYLSGKYLQLIRILGGDSVGEGKDILFSLSDEMTNLAHNWLTMYLDQFETLEKNSSLFSENSATSVSVIDVSISIYMSKVDRTDVPCTVTPLLYPLILALDDFFDALIFAACKIGSNLKERLSRRINEVCTQANRFWQCMNKLQYRGDLSSVFCFDKATFSIHWRWMKKQLYSLCSQLELEKIDVHEVRESYGRLSALIEVIDSALNWTAEDVLYRSDVYWKRMGHPLVPSTAFDHENIQNIIRISACTCLWLLRESDHRVSCVTVRKLLEQQHPSLYISVDDKVHVLNALCTALWATTDETSSTTRAISMVYDSKKAATSLNDNIQSKAKEFRTQLQNSAVYLTSGTIENLFTVGELQRLNDCYSTTLSGNRSNLKIHEQILRSYASIQLSPISEFGCILEEQSLVRLILELTSSYSDTLFKETFQAPLIARVKAYIENVLNFTSWSPSDLRPYQTILWVIAADKFSVTQIRQVLRASSSIILSSYFQHCWHNGFNVLSVIDPNLGLCQHDSSRHVEEPANDLFIGPPRLRHNIISDAFFHLFNFDDLTINAKGMVTLENYKARFLQNQKLIAMLSSSSFEAEAYWNLTYALFANTLESLSDLSNVNGVSLPQITTDILERKSFPHDEVEEIIEACLSPSLLKMKDSIVRPLTFLLGNKTSKTNRESAALGLIYVGLLRFHLILPHSDIDPGKKPTIKASEINAFLSQLSQQITTRQMMSGLKNGNFFSSKDTICRRYLDLAEKAHVKQEKQLKKQVVRPEVGPSFTDLYGEVTLFAESVASVSSVLGLVDIINNEATGAETKQFIQETEQNWQQSVHSFVYRLRHHYCYYSDICLPLSSSLQAVQYGVRELVALKLQLYSPWNQKILQIQDFLLSYPRVARPPATPFFRENLEAMRKLAGRRISKSVQDSYICSILSRLSLDIHLMKGLINYEQLSLINAVLSELGDIGISQYESSTSPSLSPGKSEEEREERRFRELFPDHEAEFSSNDTEEKQTGYSNAPNESMLIFVSGLYLRIFQTFQPTVNDTMRIQDFVVAYKTAGRLQSLTSSIERLVPESHRIGAHLYAFMLELSPQVDSTAMLSERYPTNQESDFDFHHDPCPWQTINAREPLESIQNRLQQLISAFPLNSVLVAISDVVKKLRQCDLKRTSLGKMLTGLEVILRKAQDWEQHASVHVRIGQPLMDISTIVSRWRNIELQNWPKFLSALEMRHCRYAHKSWNALYNLIVSNVKGEYLDTSGDHFIPRKVRAIPNWLGGEQRFGSTEMSAEYHPIELMKVVDTFVLTSSLGQFKERLRMIEAFAHHQILDYSLNPRPFSSANTVGLMLLSLCKYYEQFLDKMNDSLSRMRSPIEKKLIDEVKLAKWDEQSYYSLKESSEKTHRKLMRYLNDYNEALETPVSTLIEEALIEGVSPSTPCIEIPGNTSIFPILRQEEIGTQDGSVTFHDTVHLSADCFFSKNKWIVNMKKYHKKLIRMIRSNSPSASDNGASAFHTITASIFNRIDSLRKHGSKSVKQRALFDLFKTLKDQGFVAGATSFGSYAAVRDMSALLVIPTVARQDLNDATIYSERFWNRCIAEISQFRAEVNHQQSKFMSQRELHMMLGYSENGLLMLCQQRSVLASAFEDLDAIDPYVRSYEKISKNIPRNQAALMQMLIGFDEAYLVVDESLRQLLLILKTAISVVVEEKRNENAHTAITSAINLIEKNIELVRTLYRPRYRYTIITHEVLEYIEKVRDCMMPLAEDLSKNIAGSLSQEHLPVAVFTSSIAYIQTLSTIADDCIKIESEYEMIASDVSSSDCSEIEDILSSIIQTSLLVAQNVTKFSIDTDTDKLEATLWDYHHKACRAIFSDRIRVMISLFQKLTNRLMLIDFGSYEKCERYSRLIADTAVFARSAVSLLHQELIKLSSFHRNASKFLYVAVRIFRTLFAYGYCSEDNSKGDEDTEGDMKSSKFEDDVEGTGMGEGEGNMDVSDQIENEEQLLGLKGDKDNGNDTKEGKKDLKEDEAEKGMEMEADFEGELFETPQPEGGKSDNDDNNQEEIDRELGDGSDPNEEVIDEKIWDEDDEQGECGGEKFEKDSKVNDDRKSDELHTKDDNDVKDGQDEKPASSSKQNKNEDENSHQIEEDKESLVNDDLEENYEDRHNGIQVRGSDEVDKSDEGDSLKLEDMKLDSDENDDSSSVDDQGSSVNELPDELINSFQEDNEASDIPASDEVKSPEQGDTHKIDEDAEKDEQDQTIDSHTSNQDETHIFDAHGIPDVHGIDKITNPFEQETNDIDMMERNDRDESKTDADGEKKGSDNDDGRFDSGKERTQQGTGDRIESKADVPNPFRDPGDAEKYWHRRLNLLQDNAGSEDDDVDEARADGEEHQDSGGTYEFVQHNQRSSTQTLADSYDNSEGNTQPPDDSKKIESCPQMSDPMETADEEDCDGHGKSGRRFERDKVNETRKSDRNHTKQDEDKIPDTADPASTSITIHHNSFQSNNQGDVESLKNDCSDDKFDELNIIAHQHNGDLSAVKEDSTGVWGRLQSETHHLSRRLCEKLRLVMEPLVASKLQGDYRSGKRLNMKRIISYIASGYRKDKIWLRRTKPAKRDYRVLLAVDDSESMQNGGAGLMALRAMVMLINGMTQLEIGQLGIASFGEEMKILHPFQSPFTTESGALVAGNFRFMDKRTRMALCVESAMASMAVDSSSSSPQLLLLISDGRIERDSRSRLRSSLRAMSEQNILVVMLIIEGASEINKKDSILDIKEVSFEDGKPKVNFFMDNYPFPYYIIVEDLSDLPEILGDALRQWFEMLAQTQK